MLTLYHVNHFMSSERHDNFTYMYIAHNKLYNSEEWRLHTSLSRLANWLRPSGTHGPPFHGCGLYRFQNWVVRVEQASHHRSHRPWPAWNESFTLLNGSFHMLSWDSECCTNIPSELAASSQSTVIQPQRRYQNWPTHISHKLIILFIKSKQDYVSITVQKHQLLLFYC